MAVRYFFISLRRISHQAAQPINGDAISLTSSSSPSVVVLQRENGTAASQDLMYKTYRKCVKAQIDKLDLSDSNSTKM